MYSPYVRSFCRKYFWSGTRHVIDLCSGCSITLFSSLPRPFPVVSLASGCGSLGVPGRPLSFRDTSGHQDETVSFNLKHFGLPLQAGRNDMCPCSVHLHSPLKEQFTLKVKFSHHLLPTHQPSWSVVVRKTFLELPSRTALQHSPKQLTWLETWFKMDKKNYPKDNKLLHTACPEAPRSQIDVRKDVFYRCGWAAPTLDSVLSHFEFSSYSEDLPKKKGGARGVKTPFQIGDNATSLFHCQAPKMCFGLWNFTWLSISMGWGDDDWITIFGWTWISCKGKRIPFNAKFICCLLWPLCRSCNCFSLQRHLKSCSVVSEPQLLQRCHWSLRRMYVCRIYGLHLSLF